MSIKYTFIKYNSLPTYNYGQYTQYDNTYYNIVKIILNKLIQVGCATNTFS